MAGQKYSFSIPKSVPNNSHAIIYFLPSNETTKISVIAKVNMKEKLYTFKAKVKFSMIPIDLRLLS